MELNLDDLNHAFSEQGDRLKAVVDDVDEISAPTRLPGWSAGVMIGHVSSAIEALWRWDGAGSGEGIELDAVSYWQPVAAFADGSSEWAIRYAADRSEAELREGLVTAIDRAGSHLEEAASESIVVLPMGGAWLRFDQFLATRILEMTVHGLDLAAAGRSDVRPGLRSIGVTAAILDGCLDGSRPSDLTDDVSWVEAATGRCPHDDARLPVVV